MIIHKTNDEILRSMKCDCAHCSGLCCIALFFSKVDGFPINKSAGYPCINLLKDYRCKIHSQLESKKMKGCIGYDCFGAGQHVTQVIYKGDTWNNTPERSTEIFDVFIAVYDLYQIRYYLEESLLIIPAQSLEKSLQSLIDENITICNGSPHAILSFDLDEYRNRSNIVLKQVCKLLEHSLKIDTPKTPKSFFAGNFKGKNMSGTDLSTLLLIAADFENCIFNGTIFLGADTRDTNFTNADLREAVFLTQGQINSAKGSTSTKLPAHLDYPPTWR